MRSDLSVEEFEELIKNKKTKLLDVREKYEFDAGHIKGANLVPSTRFDENFEPLKIKKTDKIALYCRSGSRTSFIMKKLKEQGYKNVFHLEMGIIDWMKSGRRVVTGNK
jgi:rhodanese-related sulfurtransferase